MTKFTHCHCVICDKKLDNIDDRDDQVQPNNGLAFITYGHRGTNFFDPCNGDYLQIVVCDECLKALDSEEKLVYNTTR